jgi:hypothetical protein
MRKNGGGHYERLGKELNIPEFTYQFTFYAIFVWKPLPRIIKMIKM